MAKTIRKRPNRPIKTRQRLGKYVIEAKMGEGGFAIVYRARDTIEGRKIALKIPHPHLVTEETLEEFRREVRLAARLDHPHVLPLKNADFIDGHFVIASLLGEMTLNERIQKRMKTSTAVALARQALEAVAYAHSQRIIHCDLKPDNFLLFEDNHLRLADFGIARIAQRTLRGSGTGTVGYIAPEQAMGKPSFRSDVFSLGLVLYRMFSGQLTEWPFEWPGPGTQTLKSRVHKDLVELIRKSIQVDARRRYADAGQMLKAFLKIKRPIKPNRSAGAARSAKKMAGKSSGREAARRGGWKLVRRNEFIKQHGKELATNSTCTSCAGPMSESMTCCPWCGKDHKRFQGESSFPAYCPRCHRGMKLDWCCCPWCYGESFEPLSEREFSDRRYHNTARCDNKNCERKLLIPFMKYCPWCRRRVKKKWKIAASKSKCSRCGWGILPAFWKHCPWCSKRIPERKGDA